MRIVLNHFNTSVAEISIPLQVNKRMGHLYACDKLFKIHKLVEDLIVVRIYDAIDGFN